MLDLADVVEEDQDTLIKNCKSILIGTNVTK